MGDLDYREIDDRYDRMTENVNRMAADRAQQQEAAKWRDQVAMLRGSSARSTSGGPSGKGVVSGFLGIIIGLVIIVVAIFVIASIVGWAIATFAH